MGFQKDCKRIQVIAKALDAGKGYCHTSQVHNALYIAGLVSDIEVLHRICTALYGDLYTIEFSRLGGKSITASLSMRL